MAKKLAGREKYCEEILHRLVDACRDRAFPRESHEERTFFHANIDGLVRLKGGYEMFLTVHGKTWAKGFGMDFNSPEHLDLILTSRGY